MRLRYMLLLISIESYNIYKFILYVIINRNYINATKTYIIWWTSFGNLISSIICVGDYAYFLPTKCRTPHRKFARGSVLTIVNTGPVVLEVPLL